VSSPTIHHEFTKETGTLIRGMVRGTKGLAMEIHMKVNTIKARFMARDGMCGALESSMKDCGARALRKDMVFGKAP